MIQSASNAEHYAELVTKKFLMRELISAADHIGPIGYDDDRDIDHIIDEAEAKCLKTLEDAKVRADAKAAESKK